MKNRLGEIGRNRSMGTSAGMRRYYRAMCPKCRSCKKVYLIRAERRKLGLCTKCEKVSKKSTE